MELIDNMSTSETTDISMVKDKLNFSSFRIISILDYLLYIERKKLAALSIARYGHQRSQLTQIPLDYGLTGECDNIKVQDINC